MKSVTSFATSAGFSISAKWPQPPTVVIVALRNATMTTIADCGHFAEMEKPTEVTKLVIDFINAA